MIRLSRSHCRPFLQIGSSALHELRAFGGGLVNGRVAEEDNKFVLQLRLARKRRAGSESTRSCVVESRTYSIQYVMQQVACTPCDASYALNIADT